MNFPGAKRGIDRRIAKDCRRERKKRRRKKGEQKKEKKGESRKPVYVPKKQRKDSVDALRQTDIASLREKLRMRNRGNEQGKCLGLPKFMRRALFFRGPPKNGGGGGSSLFFFKATRQGTLKKTDPCVS